MTYKKLSGNSYSYSCVKNSKQNMIKKKVNMLKDSKRKK